MRDLGKALALPAEEIERVAKMVGFHERSGRDRARRGRRDRPERRAARPGWQALLELSGEAMGLPRHASQHPGGMVISTRPLIDVCPVVPAAMEGRQIVQWDKDSCADAGFLKIDLLGLGMLSAVERCVDEVEADAGRAARPLPDPARRPARPSSRSSAAETTGVFQIESRAQMQMLPRTRPANLDDLTVQVALVRPGPIQGGAVHPYIERRKRRREEPDAFEIPYEHPLLEPALKETLGTIVYQEQVLEVAIALAGFSSAEAEGLRRAMSRKRSEAGDRGAPPALRRRRGADTRGRAPELARAGLGADPGLLRLRLPEGALGRLRAARLPVGLAAGPPRPRSSSAPCSTSSRWASTRPTRWSTRRSRRGLRIAPPDANRSRVLCHVERERGGPVVRIGLGYVKGVRREEMEALVAERERGGPYRGVADLASRSGAGRDGLERLAWAGALDGIPAGEDGERRERALAGRGRRRRAGQRRRDAAGAAAGAAAAAAAEAARGAGGRRSPTTARPGSPSASTRWS